MGAGLIARLAILLVLAAGAVGLAAGADGLAAPAGAETGNGFGRYHALVIGNNAYTHLQPLKTAVNDASAVADLLRGAYGFEVELLLNATRYEIVTALNRLRRSLTANDNLLIYYAGHGWLDEMTDTGYWLPIDAETDNDAQWISNSTITNHVGAIAAKHVLVVADSCYSGTLTRAARVSLGSGTERSAWLKRMSRKRSRTALTSGGLEPVADGGGHGHSVFARHFLETLRGNREILDTQNIYDRIKQKIVLNADQTPNYNDIRKAGHEDGDFLFVPLDVDVSITAEAPDTSEAAQDGALEAMFWESIKDTDDPAMFEAYLERFPNGTFAPIARLKRTQLSRSVAALDQGAAPEPARRRDAPRSEFRDCADCPQMVVVPAGQFLMGSIAATEFWRSDAEGPRHRVRLPRAFAVAKYEVTQAEFTAFARDTGRAAAPCRHWDGAAWAVDPALSWQDPGYEQTGDHPATCVSWADATAYAAWLAEKTGQAYRLPSEAEWEYAARADTETSRYWGAARIEACASANVYDETAAHTHRFAWTDHDCIDGFAHTAPVGSFRANDFGLHDVLGNVWEWVADCWHETYDGAPDDGSVWQGGDCAQRIARGGSWHFVPWFVRSAHRLPDAPDAATYDTGFRVALTLAE